MTIGGSFDMTGNAHATPKRSLHHRAHLPHHHSASMRGGLLVEPLCEPNALYRLGGHQPATCARELADKLPGNIQVEGQ